MALLEPALRQAFLKEANVSLRFSFAASGALTRQIENGAPFDIFLPASDRYAQEAVKAGKADGATTRVFAQGRLAIWSKSGKARSYKDLAKPEIAKVAIANPEVAPYGLAAWQALESQQLWRIVSPKLVRGENVRQAFQFAESGNVDAALVSWTLAHDKGGVLLPDNAHQPIRHTAVVLTGSRQSALARRFIQFLLSPTGQQVLRQHGLFPAGATPAFPQAREAPGSPPP